MSLFVRVLFAGLILGAGAQAAPAAPVVVGPEPLEIYHELGATARQVNKLGLNSALTTFQMDVALRYNIALHRNIQVGALTDVTLVSASGTAVLWNLLVGPTFNFGGADLRDDFFLAIGGGMQLLSSSGTTVSALLGFELGKRVSLWQNVSWVPSVSFLLPTATGTTPLLTFNVFQMSVLW